MLSVFAILLCFAAPEASGVDAAALHVLYEELAQDPHHDLKGIVILRDGHLISEKYFNGDSADTLHDIRSATKSITAALMGLAIQRGYIRGVNDSIAAYLPRMPRDGKQAITIWDLLNIAPDWMQTMRTRVRLAMKTGWISLQTGSKVCTRCL